MTTLLLRTAGSALGSMLGGPIGGMIGGAFGAAAGYAVDQALFGNQNKVTQPRHATLDQLTSNEGASIPRIYGRARVSGEIIWATRFEEQLTVTKTKKQGAKGGLGASQKVKTYRYFANFAIGLCEGPIGGIRRVWVDSKELDLNTVTWRLYRGNDDQSPDPLIMAKEYPDPVPAYRGLAYIVFERFPMSDYGNRVPQIAVEVIRPLNPLADKVRGVCLIPGAGEFVYDTIPVTRRDAPGVSISENRHVQTHATDFLASLSNLQDSLPNARSVSFVVAWFGDDLRAGRATIAPRVDSRTKITDPEPWRVSGVGRDDARLVSIDNGKPIYGGTPSDSTVIRAIREMRSRGLAVILNPFLMMDIAAGNQRTNPWTGEGTQPALPWRGRITGEIAPGRPGTVDGSAAADAEIARFFGRSQPIDFETYTGAVMNYRPDWRYRNFILHYAQLAKLAGGVDAFLIGSELIGLTRLRGADGSFPAVAALASLARDLRAVLGNTTRIGYGADWTEYGAYWPEPGELRFPLDPLWASPHIDFIGIDCYWPVTDWRGPEDADAEEALSPYDPAYLQRRTASGEGFDWFYADEKARIAGERQIIADGLDSDWINRPKDIRNWWLNHHVERRGGAAAQTTAWVPQSKPIWFTEIGCPAVDRGGNAPNLFPDPRSSENGRPPFSNGFRDDLMMMRMLGGALNFWSSAENPISSVYGRPMVDVERIHVWAWDARPFPAFPTMASVWGDTSNWYTGHWLNGRSESVALDRFASALLAQADLSIDHAAIDGLVDGVVINHLASPRSVLDGLSDLYGFDLVASSGTLRLVRGTEKPVMALGPADLIPDRDGRLLMIRRAQDSDLPHELKLTYLDSDSDYRSASVYSRRIEGCTQRKAMNETGLMLWRGAAQALADRWLERRWTMRETAEARLRPGLITLEAGDVITIDAGHGPRLWQIVRINDQIERHVELRSVRGALDDAGGAPPVVATTSPPSIAGPPALVLFSPPIVLADPPPLLVAAAYAKPWPGGYDVRRTRDGLDEESVATLEAPATIGLLNASLTTGPLWRFDHTNTCDVTLSGGTLVSVGEMAALAGHALAAIGDNEIGWEILAYAKAELIGERRYRLSKLLRGLGGSEEKSSRMAPAGARFIALDSSLASIITDPQDIGLPAQWRIGDDAAMTDSVAAASSDALKPLAPVHMRVQRGVEGLTISFIRRARCGGDNWDLAEIPLSEDFEKYRISIMNAVGVTLRTLETDTPNILYRAADELTDFGSAQTRLRVRIAQLSRMAGEGFPTIADCLIL